MDTTTAIIFWVTCAAISLVPATGLSLAGRAGWRWPVIGAGSWALAYQLKLMLGPAFTACLPSPALLHATGWGTVSACAELLVAAVFMAGSVRRWQDAFAFGAGVGGFEVLFVLGECGWDPARIDAGALPLLFFVERALTVVGHISSRMIVFAALERRSVLRLLVALLLFAVVDGTATYGSAEGWDWSDKSLYGSFLAALAVWTVLEGAVAWWFVRGLGAATANGGGSAV